MEPLSSCTIDGKYGDECRRRFSRDHVFVSTERTGPMRGPMIHKRRMYY